MNVVSGSPGHVADAKATLTLAFCDDPTVRWLYSRPGKFAEAFPGMRDALAGSGFEDGSFDVTNDGAGAATWLRPGVHSDENAFGTVIEEFDPDIKDEAIEFLDQMDSFQPTEDHWYLPLIGVEPGRRGQGYGGSLLAHGLRRCDAEHKSAYLTSTNPRNIRLYERHGFRKLGEVQVGSSPVLTPMLRPAQDPR